MKKLLAASLLLGLLATAAAPAAHAQTTSVKKVKVKKDKVKAKIDEAERPAEGRGNHLAEMTQDLNLTAEQQTRVAAIQQEQQQQMQQLRSAGSDDRSALMQQMRTLDEATDAKMKGVLTAAQFQQYQARKKDRPRPMGPRPGGDR